MPKIVEIKKPSKKKSSVKKKSQAVKVQQPSGKDKNGKSKKVEVPDGLPSGSVVELNLSDINLEDTEYQFRVNVKVTDLIKSIQKDGQQFPVILRGNKPYQIVSGFRRITALRQLGAEKVKAIIRVDLNDEKAFAVSFIENEKQKNLTSLDKAHAIEKLKSLGKKRDEIAGIFGLSEKQITRYEKVATFPDVLKKALSHKNFQAKHGLLINSYHEKYGIKVNLAKWANEVKQRGLSSEALKKELAREVRGTKKSKRLFEKRKEGFRLFPMSFDPKKSSDEDKENMRKALDRALEMLGK